MSPLEFHYASIGYLNKHWKLWDMARHQMYVTANTIPSKKKLPNIRSWFPLPIDGAVHEESEIKDMFAKIKEKLKQDGNKRVRS